MKRRTLIFIIGAAALAVGLAAVLYLVVWPRWLVEKQEVRILVSVTCPGMSAEESEALVARPLEARLAGLEGLKALETTCEAGEVKVMTRFEPGTEALQASLAIKQGLKDLSLPEQVEEPVVTIPYARKAIWFYTLRLRCDHCTLDLLNVIQEQEIRPALLEVPGIAGVTSSGGARRELQIEADPQKLHQFGLRPSDVSSAISSHLVDKQSRSPHLIRSSDSLDPAVLLRIVVGRVTGGEVRLQDLARVKLSSRVPPCRSFHNGEPALHAVVFAHARANANANANAGDVVGKVRARLRSLAKKHADRDLSMMQLDPRQALELRLIGNDRAESWEARQISGFNDVVVSICDEREANDSRLWAWPKRMRSDLLARLQGKIAPTRSIPMGGISSALVVEVLEPSLEVRRGPAIVQWLSARAEIFAVEAEGLESRAELVIRPDPDRMAALGLTISDFTANLRAAQLGIDVANIRTRAGLLPVRLVLGKDRPSADDLRRLPISAHGRRVQVGDVADMENKAVPAVIHRCDRQQCLVIRAWGPAKGFAGWSARLRAEIEARFKGVKLRFSSRGW